MKTASAEKQRIVNNSKLVGTEGGGMFGMDARQFQCYLSTLVACILLVVIGIWLGVKIQGWSGEAGSVTIIVDSSEDGDQVQLGEAEWAQVCVEKTSSGRSRLGGEEKPVEVLPDQPGKEASPPVTSDGKREEEGAEEPVALEFNEANAAWLFSDDPGAIHFLFLSKKAPDYDQVLTEFEAAAKRLKDEKMKFSFVDVDSIPNKRLVDFFSLGDNKGLPVLRIHTVDQKNDRLLKYRPPIDEGISVKSVVDFTHAYLSGQLQPYYRSEPTPADWSKGAVKVLTGDNFPKVTRNPQKNVFVQFYAPWCGHCRTLAPVWEELGEKYRHSEGIVIAKMDATANEVADVPVRVFPTIKLFPAAGTGRGDDELPGSANLRGIDYLGPRTLESFVKFLDSFPIKPTVTGGGASSAGGIDDI